MRYLGCITASLLMIFYCTILILQSELHFKFDENLLNVAVAIACAGFVLDVVTMIVEFFKYLFKGRV